MQAMIDWISGWTGGFGPAVAIALSLAVAVALAMAVHAAAVGVLRRIVARSVSRTDDIILTQAELPMRWIMIAIAAGLAQRWAPLDEWALGIWRQALALLLPALFGWLALRMVQAFKEAVNLAADVSVADNLRARQRRTRVAILSRVVALLVVFLTICMMLVSIPGVRSVGVTLMASAGLAGLAIGAAAQPALKNLIAGVQMAFTEPIRIDDVVIVAGEWGRVEEIRLTYVVVKIWDERRLIVPVSKFLEEPFENWTRDSAQLLGTSMFYLDPTADVERLRQKLEELVRANARWDGRAFNMQVTDIKAEVMEVRALVTAADASQAFDLRCDVREGLMKFIASEMPEALPRRRIEAAQNTPTTADA